MKKILLAGQDDFLISVYSSCLRNLGYGIVVARDSGTVIGRILKTNPDLLVLDADLPGGDGFRILKELRHDPELKKIKTIMLFSFAGEQAILKNSDLGAVRYFKKTENTAKDLAEEIKRILYN